MKVLQILTELGPGGRTGCAGSFRTAAGALAQRVADFAEIAAGEQIPWRMRFWRWGIVPEFLHLDGFRDLSRIFLLRRRIKAIAPDIIHTHLMHPNLLTRIAAAGLSIPLLNTIHISERRKGKGLFFRLEQSDFPLCSACNAVSFASARFHEQALGLPAGTIQVIYNGVDPLPRPADPVLAARRAEWGMKRAAGSSARSADSTGRRGLICLSAFCRKFQRRFPRRTLGTGHSGEGPQRAELESLAAAAPENLIVRLPGFRTDAPQMGMALRRLRHAVPLRGVRSLPCRGDDHRSAGGGQSCGFPAGNLPLLPQRHVRRLLFARKTEGDRRERIVEAAFRERIAPQVISTRREMANRYIRLYDHLLR